MTGILPDTHTFVWSFTRPARLPARAAELVERSDVVWVSAVCLYEIAQKVRLGKWPEAATDHQNMEAMHAARGGALAPLEGRFATIAGLLDWPHRDPFDRMIAATALVLVLGLVLVAADTAFDGLPDLRRVW